ncbi:MAG: hypothetical protein V1838_05945 [Patescibacteria group bacterium]
MTKNRPSFGGVCCYILLWFKTYQEMIFMRFIKIVAIFLIFFVSFTNANASELAVSEQEKDVLIRFSKDPFLASLAQEAYSQLPRYGELFTEAARLTQGVDLDIVLLMHDAPDLTAAETKLVLETAKKVRDVIAEGDYDLIGFEGSDLDPTNFDTLAKFYQKETRREGVELSLNEAKQAVTRSTPYFGVLLYMKEVPTATVVGIEDMALNRLHSAVLGQIRIRTLDFVKLNDFNLLLSNLRSKIAVAKILLKLSQYKKKRAILPIGAYHEQDLRRILEDLKVKYRFRHIPKY